MSKPLRLRHMIGAGLPLVGQRVTRRLDGSVARILSGGILARTIACLGPLATLPAARGAGPGVTLLKLCEPLLEGGWRDASALAGQEYVAGHLRAQQR